MESSSQPTTDTLPDTPLIIIESKRGSLLVNFYDIFAFRELLYVLAIRDIKVRYKQTFLGIFWVIAQPLSMMVIFSLFFGKLAGISSEGFPYPVFAFAGLLPWTFFANAVNNSGNSLVGNSSLITKVYFPRLIIPVAVVASGLIDFAISFFILILLMVYYGTRFSVNLFILPILFIFTALFAVAVGMMLSAINVKYRDVRHALPFLLQLWLFATPIIYSASLVPDRWRFVLTLNPLAALVEAYRSAVFGKAIDFSGIAAAFIIIIITLLYASFVFRRMERRFADII